VPLTDAHAALHRQLTRFFGLPHSEVTSGPLPGLVLAAAPAVCTDDVCEVQVWHTH